MCTFYDPKNSLIIRDVPKGGSTTLRMWYGMYVYGQKPQVKNLMDKYFVNAGSATPQLTKDGHYKVDIYQPLDVEEKIAVKRDPVSRFVSTFVDSVQRTGMVKCDSLDDFIDNFHTYINKDNPVQKSGGWQSEHNLAWYHFCPQVNILGTDKSEYTRVFDTKDLGGVAKEYLEEKWNINFPELQMRDSSSLKKPELTTSQIDKIKEIYREDYEAGWC